jgi:hypothetical protein
MNDANLRSDIDDKRLELSTNYWLQRLDHTLTHTQTSSRLIYIVDGAVLALIYFVVQAFGAPRQIIFVMSIIMFLLMFLNLLHARFVIIQREHYRAIDDQLRRLLNQPKVQFQTVRKRLASTHGIYCFIHVVIAVFIALAAIAMILYGVGYFQEIKLLKAANP